MGRDFQEVLNRSLNERRKWEADVKHRLYVKPLGDRGLHVVKSSIDGKEFIVSGPGKTFRPGTVVPTASNTGTQGESIVSDPPPGRRGAGRISPVKWTHQGGGCPQCIIERSYIGIVNDNANHTLYAYSYSDGEFNGLLNQITLPSEIQHSGSDRWGWQLVNPNTISWTQEIVGGDYTHGIWNLGGAAGMIDHDSNRISGHMVSGGQLLYLFEWLDEVQHAYRVDPVIDAFSEFDGAIEDPVEGRSLTSTLAVVNGTHYVWSEDEPPWRWVGISSQGPDVSGPSNQGRGRAGGPIAFGGCVIGAFDGVKWIQPNLSMIHLWPSGWQSWTWTTPSFHGAQVNVSLTPLEYSVYNPPSGSLVRFGAIQNFSGVDPALCPLPTISVEVSPKGLPDVMLPL